MTSKKPLYLLSFHSQKDDKKNIKCFPTYKDLSVNLFKSMGYSIGKTIGKGNYSKVCLATYLSGQQCACKIINKNYTGEEFIHRFLPRELKILGGLSHQNIARVFKIFEKNNVVYIFMEYCKNGDMLEYIRNHGSFDELNAKGYFRQIVCGVNYLHSKDIAHRDLKCENILLTENNQVKICDFGFACLCKPSRFSNTFCGSAAYAAPEILRGIDYDPKKYDVWALGCILYIMVTSTMPFDDSNIIRMIEEQYSRNIGPILMLWPNFSADLRATILYLLEPDVTERISAKALFHCKWLQDSTLSKTKRFLSASDFAIF